MFKRAKPVLAYVLTLASVLLLAFVALSITACTSGDCLFNAGKDAHSRGDYAWAQHLFVKAAEKGNLDAGEDAYSRGDYTSAQYLFSKAAEKGHVNAMLRLGHLFRAQDNVQAYMWYNIAHARLANDPGLRSIFALLYMMLYKGTSELFYPAQFRHSISEKMTSAEIADARQMSRAWLNRYFPDDLQGAQEN